MTGTTVIISLIAMLMLIYMLNSNAPWLKRKKDNDH